MPTSPRATYWIAETQLDLADALGQRHRPADLEERTALIAAALQCAETHGFAGLERRINTMSR